MSGFAALEDVDGDTDIVQMRKEKAAKAAEAKRQEAESAKIDFNALKAGLGSSNWADEDSDDENAYFNVTNALLCTCPCAVLVLASPCIFPCPPESYFLRRANVGTLQGLSNGVDNGRSAEEEEEEEEEEEKEEEEVVAAPTANNGHAEPPKPKKQKPKDEKLMQELAEVDSLLADLETSKKDTAEGISKAAAKRAKKKARETGGEVRTSRDSRRWPQPPPATQHPARPS